MSKTTKARVFVPLTKVDEAQRLVYGTITQEILDKSGEVMDYESSKPFFEKWSNDIHTASNGLSKGNLRVMHGLSVAGKLTDINFNDEDKSIDVCAKVVDDVEWEKVIEGCYTGFSVGGKYEKKWTDNGVKKYTAGPNEVSLVDNPCVGSATLEFTKADGTVDQIMMKNATPATDDAPVEEEVKPAEEPVQGQLNLNEPTNDQVVAKATEMAKAAEDGSTWMNHVEAARDLLIKSATPGDKEEKADDEGQAKDGDKEVPAGETEASDEPVAKTTPPGVKQTWATSDNRTFDKKADAVAHELTLTKAEPTEAEKLKARLEKALAPPTEEEKTELLEDFDRLGKALNALSTPFGADGKPALQKGMYNINRFSSLLSDMASLSRCIKSEAQREGGDTNDSTVSAEILSATKTLGASFITYATDQVKELLAGMDDDVLVTHYDYYYNADGVDNELSKDVCSLISDYRDSSREVREVLGKVFGMTDSEAPVETDELNPSLQKRLDELAADRDTFKKIAEDAIGQIETLTKRVDTIEETPLPRAPRNVQLMEGDSQFFGKTVKTDEDKVEVLQDLLAKHGPDGLATMMIKAAHATGGQRLSLKS